MNGFLIINKPRGLTSHTVVNRVRRIVGQKRIGHTGTLDPLATGVLPLALGQATRLSEYLLGGDKRYRATLKLGETTASYDSEMPVLETRPVAVTEVQFQAALAPFRGDIQQVPPAYSAIQLGGQRAYDLARKGQPVELPPRPVTIYTLNLHDWQPPFAVVDVHCSSGTYIRSMAHDIGQTLGCGAHLTALQRTQAGPYALADSYTLEDIETAFASGIGDTLLLSMASALEDWPMVMLSDADALELIYGRSLPLTTPAEGLARACLENGSLVAVVHAQGGRWRPVKVLAVQQDE